MRRKLYAKVMASAALLSAISLPAHAATQLSDIDGSYAKDAIMELVNKGIINGKGDGKFDPTGKIERQDFAIILAKALQLDTSEAPAAATFRDVPTTHYSFAYVEAAAKAGLIKGLGDGNFGNGVNLSRQDMAVLFVRALGVDAAGKASNLKFSDASQIADYAKDAVAAAVELGLIAGTGNGQFNPTGNAERQAVALVASKFLKQVEEKKQSESSPTPSTEEQPAPPAEPDKPVAPPTTPSVPSSGGSGGSSSPDVTAPRVTLLSSSPVRIGNYVQARSNENGTLYLIPEGPTPRSRSELESLSSGRGVATSTANEITRIPTSELFSGTYRVFAVDAAGNVSAPSAAIELVESSGEYNVWPKPEAKIWLNSGSSANTFLLDSVSSDPLTYNTRNINDLIEIRDGATELRIGDYLGANCFAVIDPSNPDQKVANLLVDSSSDLIEWLGDDPNELGLMIRAKEGANQHSEAFIEFTLWSDDSLVLGHAEIPILFDDEAPTVTNSTYENGGITLEFNEEVLIRNLNLTYSFDNFDSSEFMTPGADYDLNTLDNITYRIELTDSFLSNLTLPVEVRISFTSAYDRAGNSLDAEPIDITIN